MTAAPEVDKPGIMVAYRILCGFMGVAWLVVGASLFAMFFAFHSPGGRADGLFVTMGPQGHYLAAFAGCALMTWASCW